jgi:hypothetical protein
VFVILFYFVASFAQQAQNRVPKVTKEDKYLKGLGQDHHIHNRPFWRYYHVACDTLSSNEDAELIFKHLRRLLEDKIVRSHGNNTLQELGPNQII